MPIIKENTNVSRDQIAISMNRARRIARAVGLVECTSDTQAKNGTIMWRDPETRTHNGRFVKYQITAAGYVRRYMTSGYIPHYQLNKRRYTKTQNWNGYDSEVICQPGDYEALAKIMAPLVLKYRNN